MCSFKDWVLAQTLIQQARPRLTGIHSASHAGMARPVAVVAEGKQVLQVVAATILQVLDVVDLNAPQALAVAVLARVSVPGEHSAA